MSFLDHVYARAPVPLQNLMVAAYGLRLRRLRYGGVHSERLADLRRSEMDGPGRVEQRQREGLARVLAHARDRALHYQERIPTDSIEPAEAFDVLRSVEPLEKRVLREEPERVLARGTPAGRLHWISTSGTTGTPLRIAATPEALQTNYAFFARFLGWAGVAPHDRSATFAGRTIVPAEQTGPPFWRYNRASDTLLCSSYHLSEATFDAYVDALSEFEPLFLDSYPSALFVLARHILDTGRTHRIRPRAIVTSSETLLTHQRAAIEEAFGCRVWDQYGSAEMCAFISQCEEGTYHVHPEYGVLEIVGSKGEPAAAGEVGEMLCTGFINDAMPLVRYRIGDSAAWAEGPCGCGRAFPALDRLYGRTDDLIVTPDGRYVGRLDPIFKGSGGIREAQIEQLDLGTLVVRVCAEEGVDPDVSQIDRELRKRLGEDMQIRFEQVEHIPRTASGKFRAVISRVGGAER